MIIKTKGRLALMLAAGLFLCFAGPSPGKAASSNEPTAESKSDNETIVKHSVRHSKRHAQRGSGKVKSKSSEMTSSEKTEFAAASSTALPASVANAKAELSSNVSAYSANAVAEKGNRLLLAADKPDGAKAADDADVVASDQFNDLDRALQDGQSPPPAQPEKQTVAVVVAKPAAAALVNSDSSTWDKTSLIGKIFVAVGALLTVASAARMFIA
jgi:hypothetical protein